MEWYTLDDSLRRDEVIEGFQSFIWTERYQANGDFQIVTKSTFQARSLLAVGTWITKQDSTYVMIIDTVVDSTDENGVRLITVTGSSLEALLDDRVGMPMLTDTTTQPNWILTDTAANVMREMFQTVCVSGGISSLDTIPFYHAGTLLPIGSIPEDDTIITVTAQPDTLYSSLTKIAQTYYLGFRFAKDGDSGNIYFEVYTGNDLTSDQTVRNPVIFDPSMDNLEKVSLLTSAAQLKTVAYVFATNGSAVVYSPTADPTASGYGRRILLINSSNSDPASDALNEALQSEGQVALAQQRLLYAFDGELPQQEPFVYGVDYSLGDIVEERQSDGFGNQMLVTEQIFTSDDTGERAYPTLSIKQVITPGTWLVVDPDEDWADVDDSVTWSTV